METPSLIDMNFRNYLYEKLRTCHDHKLNIYSYVLNIGFFLGFVLLMLIIFFLAKKPKLTPEELAEKMNREQHYIVSKIRDYKSLTGNNTSSIPNLPILT